MDLADPENIFKRNVLPVFPSPVVGPVQFKIIAECFRGRISFFYPELADNDSDMFQLFVVMDRVACFHSMKFFVSFQMPAQI